MGSLAWDAELKTVVEDPALGCLSSSGQVPERVLDVDIGTSYAAPLVARVASAIVARYPEFNTNLVRALVLQAAAAPTFAEALVSGSPSERRRAVEKLVGHGTPKLSEAIASGPHRTVLIAEESIPMDGTHVYDEKLSPTGLKRRLVRMEPPGKLRSRGANQLARIVFGQRPKEEDGDTYHLVVQCRQRWASEAMQQPYALAVCLWRTGGQTEIYDEIRTRVEIPVEVEVER